MISYINPHDLLEFDPPFVDATGCDAQLSIIELGSGSGLVASVVAKTLKPGKDLFIATDLPEVRTTSVCPRRYLPSFDHRCSQVCPLLEQNLLASAAPMGFESPNQSLIVVKALSWGNRNEAIDLGSAFCGKEHSTVFCRNLTHIVCSDLVFSSIEYPACSNYSSDLFPGSICPSSAHSARPNFASFHLKHERFTR